MKREGESQTTSCFDWINNKIKSVIFGVSYLVIQWKEHKTRATTWQYRVIKAWSNYLKMDNSVLNGVSPKGTKGMDQYMYSLPVFPMADQATQYNHVWYSFSLMKFQAPLPHKLSIFNFIVELVFLKERLIQSHWNSFRMVWIMQAECKNCNALILKWIQNWFSGQPL